MNKPSTLKSVSISEMLHLREEEGLSNQEIAEKIGCSYNTVNRHIGPAPFKKLGKKRKSPSLPATELPEMRRESFKERCERMANELHCNPTHWVPDVCAPTTEEILAAAPSLPENICKTDANLIEEAILTSKDRINEAVKSVVDGFNYYNATVSREKPTVSLLSDRIDELVSVFGKMVVIEYIRCRLYELGMIEDAVVIDRDGLLAKLNELQGGERLD